MSTQTSDLEQRAREALGWVESSGIDAIGVMEPIRYGLEHGLYTQKDVDAAQSKFRVERARKALGWVESSGIGGMGIREHIDYGLEHGLYTQKDVDAAQKRYNARRRA